MKTTADGVPVPDTFTVCGGPGALSFTCTTALALPTDVGKNCTLIVHWSPGCSGDAAKQVSLSVNWAGFAPVSVACEKTRFSFPLLVTVIVRMADDVETGWFPNPMEPGLTDAPGSVPVPDSDTSWPCTVTVPGWEPVAFGWNTTLTKQLCPAGTPPAQLESSTL